MSTSRSLYPRASFHDDSYQHSNPHIHSAEPLLEDELGNTEAPKKSTWAALTAIMTPSRSRRKDTFLRSKHDEKMVPWRRKGWSRSCLKLLGIVLLALGVLQLFSLVGTLIVLLLPDRLHRIVQSWGHPGHIGYGLSSWPTDFSRDVLPIPCHSHNDYWRTVPLFSAVEAGCIGVEADIWLFDERLYVGHSISSLTPNRTINSLYIDPLLDILEGQNPKQTLLPRKDPQINGVFDTNPEQPLIFLIDFKTAGATLWPYVQSALEPLRKRNYLTRFDGNKMIHGPIIVVGTGNTPFDLIISDESNPHHDIFFDAPLDAMVEEPKSEKSPAESDHVDKPVKFNNRAVASTENHMTGYSSNYGDIRRSDEEGQGRSGTADEGANSFNASNSFYASVAFSKTIGQIWDGHISDHQMKLLRGQIRGAHERGLKVRYWDLPFWPIGLRNHIWDVLVMEGVDILNVDDLKGATKRNWQKHNGWWNRMKGAEKSG